MHSGSGRPQAVAALSLFLVQAEYYGHVIDD